MHDERTWRVLESAWFFGGMEEIAIFYSDKLLYDENKKSFIIFLYSSANNYEIRTTTDYSYREIKQYIYILPRS